MLRKGEGESNVVSLAFLQKIVGNNYIHIFAKICVKIVAKIPTINYVDFYVLCLKQKKTKLFTELWIHSVLKVCSSETSSFKGKNFSICETKGSFRCKFFITRDLKQIFSKIFPNGIFPPKFSRNTYV